MDVAVPKMEEGNMLNVVIQVFESGQLQNDGLDDGTERDIRHQRQRTSYPGFERKSREKHCLQRHWTWKANYGGWPSRN